MISSTRRVAYALGAVFGVVTMVTGSTSEANRLRVVVSSPVGSLPESIIHSFGNPSSAGYDLNANLVADARGNLYGSTISGGASGGRNGFQAQPVCTQSEALARRGNSGTLYGVTLSGGTYGYGTVYALTPSGQKWKEHVLHSFGPSSAGDGEYPATGLLIDGRKDLYGVTTAGGLAYGTVFEVTPPATSKLAWNETVIHAFTGPNAGDGYMPYGSLVFDATGGVNGTTIEGGTGCVGEGCGIVFKLTPHQGHSGWTERILYRFNGAPDGEDPYAGLTVGANGALYGATPAAASLTAERSIN